MLDFRELIASWRQRARDEKIKATECEDEGWHVWSNGHSGMATALLLCARELESMLLSGEEADA